MYVLYLHFHFPNDSIGHTTDAKSLSNSLADSDGPTWYGIKNNEL